MSDEEEDQQTTADSEQPNDGAFDTQQSSADAEPSGQTEQEAGESDQPADQAYTGDQTTEQAQEQSSDIAQTAGQAEQVALAEGEHTDQDIKGSTTATDNKPASRSSDAPLSGDEGTTAEPEKAGAGAATPRKRLFRFVIADDPSPLNLAPDPVRAGFLGDMTDYAFAFALAGAADGNPARMIDDGWERVPIDGIMDFPLNTIERSKFFIGVSLLPNAKVDPKASASDPLKRIGSIHTDDFARMKASDAPTLVKKFPDGVFIIDIRLPAFYIQIVETGGTGYQDELKNAKIAPEDVAYNALSPFTDSSGKVVGTKHDVVYWSTELRLTGKKYVP
jgi:hypothetical protein